MCRSVYPSTSTLYPITQHPPPQTPQGIGGNICNASPISDLNPTLLAAGVKLTIATKGMQAIDASILYSYIVCIYYLSVVAPLTTTDANRVIVIYPSFFTGYKKTAIKPGEILLSILIPYTKEVGHVITQWRVYNEELWGLEHPLASQTTMRVI